MVDEDVRRFYNWLSAVLSIHVTQDVMVSWLPIAYIKVLTMINCM